MSLQEWQTAWGKLQWPLSFGGLFFWVGGEVDLATSTALSPCFYILKLLYDKMLHKETAHNAKFFPKLSTAIPQLSVWARAALCPLARRWSARLQDLRPSIISLLMDLLNSCWVRYAFCKVMVQKCTEGGRNQQLLIKAAVIFLSHNWGRGGPRMRCLST